VEFEKKNVPTVLICSTVYEPVASALAKALGVRDLTIATIPHPFSWSGLTREQISERVSGVFDRLVKGLTQSAASTPTPGTGGTD